MSVTNYQSVLQTRAIGSADAARLRPEYLESLIAKRFDKHWLYGAVPRTTVPTGSIEVNAFNALTAAQVIAADGAFGGIDSTYMDTYVQNLQGARLRMTVRGSSSDASLTQAGMTIGVLATAMVVGREYCIQTLGTTTFTNFGAANNTVGTIFVCTAVGSGTGTVIETNFVWAGVTPSSSTTKFTTGNPTVVRQDLALQSHRAKTEISNELLADLPPSGYQTLCDSLAMVLLESITSQVVKTVRGFAEVAGQISNVTGDVVPNDPLKLLLKLPQTVLQNDDAVLVCSNEALLEYCDTATAQQVANTLKFSTDGGYNRICGARVILSQDMGSISDADKAAMMAFPMSHIRIYETPLMVSIDTETRRSNNATVIYATHRAVGTALFSKNVFGLSFSSAV